MYKYICVSFLSYYCACASGDSMRCRRTSLILGELDTDIQIDDRDLNIYICVCVYPS